MKNSKTTQTNRKTPATRSSSLDAIDFLTSQHREVDSLFVQLESETGSFERMAVFRRIAAQLTMHTAIEEAYFYPAVGDQQTENILLESIEEHLSIKELIANLLDTLGGGEAFGAQIKVLKAEVEHHVDAEERDLFPKVKRIFNRDDLLSLAEAMEEKHNELVGNSIRPRERRGAPTRRIAPR